MSNAGAGTFEDLTKPYGSDFQNNQPILVLFNGVYVSPNTLKENAKWEGDAQIAARRAMSKRNSRSYSARVSRAKSWKKEKLVKPAKPTVDTSFTRHRGDIPRQVYPPESGVNRAGSTKYNFLGLRRPSTRIKGLGITKGTPVPENSESSYTSTQHIEKEPKTADSLVPASHVWAEISPSDRPIPIGISIPSDSLPDFSPYQSNRLRSGSDATLVTPSIIITPAAAMKSVWSPDTESEYTPSVYSRATFNPFTTSNVPPVPAIPADVSQHIPNRPRKDTLDSAGTAFEEEESPVRLKERITSSATVFEEDEVPLRSSHMRSHDLSIDTTATIPTPRRSQGWWNFITTPFESSRANSAWITNGHNGGMTPDIPMMPQQFTRPIDSSSTTTTYVWSVSEKSLSPDGNSLATGSVPAALGAKKANEQEVKIEADRSVVLPLFVPPTSQARTNGNASNVESINQVRNNTNQQPLQQVPKGDQDVTSPLSPMSASPIVGTATIGTMLIPRQIQETEQQQQQPAQQVLQPAAINIEKQEKTIGPDPIMTAASSASNVQSMAPPITEPASTNPGSATVARSQSPPHFVLPVVQTHKRPAPSPQVNVTLHAAHNNPAQASPPEFLPPPRVAYKSSESTQYNSRSSSPISTTKLKKHNKKHRKVFKIMEWLPFGRRKSKDQEVEGKKKRSRGRKWCWGCCCCLIILILLAIILPIVLVVGARKSNEDSKSAEPPSRWLNLTGYPPIPTGVSTIAQPEAVAAQQGCASITTMWSCAIPKEEQTSDSRNKPDQPNMTFKISFENGTVRDGSKTLPTRRAVNPVYAGAFVRSRHLHSRAAPSAVPAPPELEDYAFLGNTTDGDQAPFEGEETPFFLTLNPTDSKTRRLALRADTPGSNFTGIIPDPELDPDGTAAAVRLLPSASNQPLRLFNRGKEDEHYGFFVYFDRSIFLKDVSRNFTNGGNPADVDGGSRKDAATQRCTWAQTRLLVQIWTRSQSTKALLRSGIDPDSEDPLVRPGTFPYPVTVVIDRHGGRADQKMLYCYKMERDGTITNDEASRTFFFEDRKFGGTLVNPAKGVSTDVQGPVDGGTGGCSCKWQNWST